MQEHWAWGWDRGHMGVGTGESAWHGPTNAPVSGSDCVHGSLEAGRQTGADEDKGHRRDPPSAPPRPGCV